METKSAAVTAKKKSATASDLVINIVSLPNLPPFQFKQPSWLLSVPAVPGLPRLPV